MKTLVVYLMAGRDTPELAEAAVAGGADIVELGFPFSDPLADGPVIRRAAERALADGMRTRRCLECLAETRARVDVPLIPMTYASLLEAYGYERFEADARAAGATSLIVADLPAGERPELKRVQLVAPTSTDGRIQIAARHTDGWLYLVTVTGTTGARERLSPSLAGLVARTRSLTDLPLYAGFGISTPEQAAEAAELADGIVVGSRAVEVAEDGPDALQAYVETLRCRHRRRGDNPVAMRIFSGIQPTGSKHFGNYSGGFRQYAATQELGDAFFCIVDLHSITVEYDPADLRERTLDLAAMLFATGTRSRALDGLRPEPRRGPHAEAAWLLSSVASFGELRRMTQFKEKSDQQGSVSAGLLTYPVLMAGDILLYQTDLVPIGDDQRQHLELSRNIAERFNCTLRRHLQAARRACFRRSARGSWTSRSRTGRCRRRSARPRERFSSWTTPTRCGRSSRARSRTQGRTFGAARTRPGSRT